MQESRIIIYPREIATEAYNGSMYAAFQERLRELARELEFLQEMPNIPGYSHILARLSEVNNEFEDLLRIRFLQHYQLENTYRTVDGLAYANYYDEVDQKLKPTIRQRFIEDCLEECVPEANQILLPGSVEDIKKSLIRELAHNHELSKVNGDGNCQLYSILTAAAAQNIPLHNYGINDHHDLRAKIVEQMRTDYENNTIPRDGIIGKIYQLLANGKLTDKIKWDFAESEASLNQAIADYFAYLALDRTWMDEDSCKAACKILQVNIMVAKYRPASPQPQGPVFDLYNRKQEIHDIVDFYSGDIGNKTLVILHNGTNHYDAYVEQQPKPKLITDTPSAPTAANVEEDPTPDNMLLFAGTALLAAGAKSYVNKKNSSNQQSQSNPGTTLALSATAGIAVVTLYELFKHRPQPHTANCKEEPATGAISKQTPAIAPQAPTPVC